MDGGRFLQSTVVGIPRPMSIRALLDADLHLRELHHHCPTDGRR